MRPEGETGAAIAATRARLRQKLGADEILFIKRFTYTSNHYYTEYLDSQWTPGGGIFVLSLTDGSVRQLAAELTGRDLRADGSVVRRPAESSSTGNDRRRGLSHLRGRHGRNGTAAGAPGPGQRGRTGAEVPLRVSQRHRRHAPVLPSRRRHRLRLDAMPDQHALPRRRRLHDHACSTAWTPTATTSGN